MVLVGTPLGSQALSASSTLFSYLCYCSQPFWPSLTSSDPVLPPLHPLVPPIMGDLTKLKSVNASTHSSSHGSNSNVASSSRNRDFTPQPNLDTQIAASPSPVLSAKDAHIWLKKKGWPIDSKQGLEKKLADILFSASLSFKLLPEANTTIRSITFLLRDIADDIQTLSPVDKVIDQLSNRLNEPIDTLNEAIASTKSFIEAVAQQQTTYLISIQDSFKQHSDIVKTLGEAVEKCTSATNPHGLANSSWPPLPLMSAHEATAGTPVASRPSLINNMSSSKLAQHVALASKQSMFDYSPMELGNPPKDKLINAQWALKSLFNDWINFNTPPAEEGATPALPSRTV